MLVLNMHGSHVTLEAIELAQQFEINMVTWPLQISHILQPLNVNCFKPFKITFKKEKDNAMARNNHCEQTNAH
jgi:hypothetical protein